LAWFGLSPAGRAAKARAMEVFGKLAEVVSASPAWGRGTA
jgi:hypothetical protein